jgi:hypothetical protein
MITPEGEQITDGNRPKAIQFHFNHERMMAVPSF